jgi:hypothetical protein
MGEVLCTIHPGRAHLSYTKPIKTFLRKGVVYRKPLLSVLRTNHDGLRFVVLYAQHACTTSPKYYYLSLMRCTESPCFQYFTPTLMDWRFVVHDPSTSCPPLQKIIIYIILQFGIQHTHLKYSICN